MKISKIYSNKEDIFPTIRFDDGFNVIFGDVKSPKDLNKDSHNLGKTLLISLIEFLLLKRLSNQHFLKKHFDRFKDFKFYLEIKLNNCSFLTIKREVENNSKVSFKKHEERNQDLRDLSLNEWDHCEVSFEKAREMLDSYLSFTSIGGWTYRKGISYFLRDQGDYRDVFQIEKFTQGDHIDWKPYLAKLLGLNDELVERKFLLDQKISEKYTELTKLQNKIQIKAEDYDKLKGTIEIKESQIEETEDKIEKFNFYEQELKLNKQLVEELESKIAELNNDLYNINYEIGKIELSLTNNLKFNLDEIKETFEDVKVYFNDKLIKDYELVLDFNKKVYLERKKYLKERLENLNSQKESKLLLLKQNDQKRSELLGFLRGEESFKKFKQLQSFLVLGKTEVLDLKNQLTVLDSMESLRAEIEKLEEERKKLVMGIVKDIKEGNNIYKIIRTSFNEIIKRVFNQSAILSISLNQEGNIEFNAEILKNEKTLETTSEGEGTSWRKILCAAFDLSVLRAYTSSSFFRFVYHDGILEGLDNRKKSNFLEVVRDYVRDYDIQYVLTAISDDLPRDEKENKIYFKETEVVRTLTDEGDSGRLFKMPKF